MNQLVKYAKRGKMRVLVNRCELRKNDETEKYVGGKSCQDCPLFMRKFNRGGEIVISCDHTKMI